MEIKFDYPGLDEGEKVYLVFHRHWIAFVKLASIVFAMALVPIIIAFLPDIISIPTQIFAIATGIYFLILMAVLMTNWIDFYYDLFIITDRKIINIDQSGLFGYKSSELLFGQIIDITFDKDGFWPMILGFGSLSIKTAARTTDFVIFPIARPDEVSREIKSVLNLHRNYDKTVPNLEENPSEANQLQK